MGEVKVYLECSLCKDPTDEDHAKYVTELCNSLSLLSKYILDQDNIFKPTVHREECGLFITDCFETSGFCAETEVKAGLEALFDLRWSGNAAVAIAFTFLHKETLRFGCFKTFSIDIFQVPHGSPELSHCICIGDRTIDSLVPALRTTTQRTEEGVLPPKKQDKEMLALDLWPSLANRVATCVLDSLTGTQYHDIAHGGDISNVLEEIRQVMKICQDTPELEEFLRFIFSPIVSLQILDRTARKNRAEGDESSLPVTRARTISVLRKWPLNHAIDSLYRIGQSDQKLEDQPSPWPQYSFIIEDKELMAKDLRKILSNLKPHVNKKAIDDAEGLSFNDIAHWIYTKWEESRHHPKDSARRSLVLMDLEIGRRRKGLDFTRRLKEKWPDITCLVVSGFEEEVENAFSLGADGYIIKPIEAGSLLREIDRLKYIGTVCYILDKDSEWRYVDHMNIVRSTATDPNETNEEKWNLVLEGLRKLFAYRRIQLSTKVVSGNRTSLSEELADAMEADSFLIDCNGGLRGQHRPLFVDIARITKLHGPDKSFTILLPPELMHKRPIWLCRYLRDTFSEEKDLFQHKPVFRFPFPGSECTVDAVYNQITFNRKIKYDVRYSILFPIEPIFGRFEQKQLEDANEKGTMFVVPLINAFGFSVPIDMLIPVLNDADVKKGEPQREMFETIIREIYVRDREWPGFWRGKARSDSFDGEDPELSRYRREPVKYLGEYYERIKLKLKNLAEELQENEGFLTFESWVRHTVDRKMKGIWGRIWSKFGGDTRIELFLRGDWLNDEGKRVEDIHILVYILTRYAPTHRKWLKDNTIKEIKEKLGEKEVFLQEERVKVYAF